MEHGVKEGNKAMFKHSVPKVVRLASEDRTIDPSKLGDPLAMRINWTPAKSGGASFRTHHLVEVNSNRLEFRTSIGAKVFIFFFILLGIGIIVGFLFPKMTSGGLSFDKNTIIPIVIGMLFIIAGGGLLHFGTTPIVFDKTKGAFWKGRKAPDKVPDRRTLKHFAELEKIHALQLISEFVRGDKRTYYSYELNLVLKNRNRINVVDHGNKTRLREDANTLSAFLGKPVWDAI